MIILTEPHLSAITHLFEEANLDPALVTKSGVENGVKLEITRMITKAETSTKNPKGTKLKSICKINGTIVTLKALKMIVTPLIAIVDAAAASTALKDPKACMAILDTGIDKEIESRAKTAKKKYRERRKDREKIENELNSRILPSSFSDGFGEEDTEMLMHWVEEIDKFEARMNEFQSSILSSCDMLSVMPDEEFYDEEENTEKETLSSKIRKYDIQSILKRFASCSWSNKDFSVETSFYSCLLDIRDCLKQMDDQLIAAHASHEVLSSLSTKESAAYAIEKSRNFLYEVCKSDNNSEVVTATEKSHELLNNLEDALKACDRFIADDSKGLISTLEKIRQSVSFSCEDLDMIITDWGSLSRKHGIDAFSLPALQSSLKQEMDGNVEAKLELPKARIAEEESLEEYIDACKHLTRERFSLASRLSTAVTERIKGLGMEGSTFQVDFRGGVHACNETAGYSENAVLGLDSASFLILHRQSNERINNLPISVNGDERGGRLDVVGSSGEKARILLAIETELPGSIGACYNRQTSHSLSSIVSPIAVIYDEIDAHVGGRAAVAMAKLLLDQTRCSSTRNAQKGQIISITHSAAVAAVSDRHLVIQKLPMNKALDGRVKVIATNASGSERREELARMAAGDLAGDEEGLRFAEALLREGSIHKER